jgi:hypothetical protein
VTSDIDVRHDPYAAFRVPAYRRFLAGSLLVQIGTGAQGLAIGWEMYQRTSDAMALGLVGLAQAVPMIGMSLPAGYLADRFNRRNLLIGSLLGASLLSLALAALSASRGPIWGGRRAPLSCRSSCRARSSPTPSHGARAHSRSPPSPGRPSVG